MVAIDESSYITMGARLYDPDLGQFLSVDPLADIFAFTSPYVYANNSPINISDPSGLAPEKDYGEKFMDVLSMSGSELNVNNFSKSLGEQMAAVIENIDWQEGFFLWAENMSDPWKGFEVGGAGGRSGDKTKSKRTGDESSEQSNGKKDSNKKSWLGRQISGLFNAVSSGISCIIDGVSTVGGLMMEGLNALSEMVGESVFETTETFDESVLETTETVGEVIIEGIIYTTPMEIETEESLKDMEEEKGVNSNQCFIRGTFVLTDSGLECIQNIQKGDSVFSYNILTNQKKLTVVLNNFERKSKYFIKLYFDDDSLTCTFEHPFFVNETWVAAKDLVKGDSIFLASGNKLMLDSMYYFQTDTATTVYNMEVAGNHNYFVSADGVLVHNKPKRIGNIPKVSFNKLSNNYLKELGVDAHLLKRNILGNDANIKHYDIHLEKHSKELYLIMKSDQSVKIRTYEYIE